ncbi:MAG TPA: transporter, partial [Propionibacteriaceae bacterium]|nr:transporter [Propionibacteriaceae bacterium]
MIDILVKALALIAIIGIGLGIKRLGWARTEDVGLFAKLVLRVTLPCALASAFNDFTITASLLVLSALGLVVNLIQQTTGYLMGRTAEE